MCVLLLYVYKLIITNPAIRLDCQPRDGRVSDAKTYPGTEGDLQSPTHKIPNHVSVTDEDIECVELLFHGLAVKVFSKRSFDTDRVFVYLLRWGRGDGRDFDACVRALVCAC